MRRYVLLLVIILVLGGESLLGKETSQVFILSPSLDYFPAFLEVHLRRLLSPSQVHLVTLPQEELPRGDVSLLVFLGKEQYFSSILLQIPQNKKPLFLFWERKEIEPSSGFSFCKIRVEGEEIIEAL